MIGEEFGSYKLVRKLGEGGMGEVYLARHLYMERPAAIKVLLPELCANQDIVNRFFAEARATELIRHPNIVQVFDCGIHAPTQRGFIVMEYLDGENLADHLGRLGKPEVGDAVDIAIQTAEALAAAHAAGIVHRDLKPDNVFLTAQSATASDSSPGQRIVKVLDFGIAKLAYPGSISKTVTGSIMGTPLYMSPEQGRGLSKVDFRTDIYSLGCILFEMLAGRPVFEREAPGDLIIAHATEAPPRLSEVVPEISSALDGLVSQLLQKSPDARPQSMTEVAQALRQTSSGDAHVSAPRRGTELLPPGTSAPVPRSRSDAGSSPSSPPVAGHTRKLESTGDHQRLPASSTPASRADAPSAGTPRRSGSTTTLSDTASQTLTRAPRRPSTTARFVAGTVIGGCVVAAIAAMAVRGRSRTTVAEPSATTTAPEAVLPTVVAPNPPANPATSASPPSASAAQTPEAKDPAPTAATAPSATPDDGPHHRSGRRRDPSAAASPSFAAARQAFGRGDYPQALIYGKRAEREGAGAAAYLLVGKTYEKLEHLADAIEAYRMAVEIDPSNSDAKKLLRNAKNKK